MRSLRALACEVVLVLLAACAVAQTPAGPVRQDPLSQILGFAWDVAQKGPLVVVLPGFNDKDKPFAELDLKPVVLGGLTALVPREMTTVDSRPPDSPNLYDGLPQEAKVMYLVRSFDPGQWARATSEGIGKGDLHGEQVAVFESILPNPLRYNVGSESYDEGRPTYQGGKESKSLPAAEREAIKLRIVRDLGIAVPIVGGGFSGGFLPPDEKPGTPIPFIEEPKDAAFGRQILVKGPNLPKRSDLDLADPRLSVAVPLIPGELVRSLLTRVGKATGLNLVPATGLRYREVSGRGGNVPAHDLLAAVTLGLCGTFRRVGDAYVLTNDLVGMGVHQAWIGVWEDEYKKEVDARKDVWRAEIYKNPAFRKIPFHGPIYDTLNAQERENLESNEQPHNEPHFIPIDQAGKTLRNAYLNMKGGLDVDRTKVGLDSSVRYEIVLPGLGHAWWRGGLDNTDRFAETPNPREPAAPKSVATPLDPKGGLAGIALRADTPTQARAAVASAARHAAPFLLLETRSPEALKAAVAAGKAAGVPVGLVLRPWSLTPGERVADPDRILGGEHGAALAAKRRALPSLQRHYVEIGAYDPPVRELVAPLDPATDPHVRAAAVLAATPGLAQVAVFDLYPHGYARAGSRYGAGYWYSNELDTDLAYGYTEALRAAHLAAQGVDPLDIEVQSFRLGVDLTPAWNGGYNPQQGTEEWQKTKGDASHSRAVALARALLAAAPGVPIRLPGEMPLIHLPPLRSVYLYDLKSADALPVAPEDFGGGPQPPDSAERTVLILDDPDPIAFARVAAILAESLAKPNRPLFLDLTAVAPARSETVLSRWIKAK